MTVTGLLEFCARLIESIGARGVTPRGLAVALALGQPRRLAAEGLICQEGTPSDALFVLMRGEVRVQRADEAGEPRVLVVLKAPLLIGQLGITDRSLRSATCVVESEKGAFLVELDRLSLDLLMNRPDEVGAAFRRLIGASIAQQLGTQRAVLASKAEAALKPDLPTELKSESLKFLGAVIQDWDLDESDLDQIEVVEQERQRKGPTKSW